MIHLLNGDLVPVDPVVDVEHMNKINLTRYVARVLNIFPFQVHLCEMEDRTVAMVTPFPQRTLSFRTSPHQLITEMLSDESTDCNWFAECVHPQVVEAILPHLHHPRAHFLYANPHPSVVETILLEEDLPLTMFRNPDERVVDKCLSYLRDPSSLLRKTSTWGHLARNRNPRALSFLLSFPCGSEEKEHLKKIIVAQADILAKHHGHHREWLTWCVEELAEWPLGFLETPHVEMAQCCLDHLSRFPSSSAVFTHIAVFGTHRLLLDHLFSSIERNELTDLPSRFWTNESDRAAEWMLEWLGTSLPLKAASNANDRIVDRMAPNLSRHFFPQVLANSNPRMIRAVIEWMEQNMTIQRSSSPAKDNDELNVEDNQEDWLYATFVKQNTHPDMILYVWERWPRWRPDEEWMLWRMAKWSKEEVEIDI